MSKTSEVYTELQQCAEQTWSIIGYDIIDAYYEFNDNDSDGVPRDEVIDVVIDNMRNHQPWKDLSENARLLWEATSFEQKTELMNAWFDFGYYGV